MISAPNVLNIGVVNVRGNFSNRPQVVENLIREKSLDVLICTETHLISSTSFRSSFNFHSVQFVPKFHLGEGHKAGVAVIYNPSIPFPPILESEDTQLGCWLMVRVGNLRIAAVYIPPNSNQATIEGIFRAMQPDLPGDFLLCGDLNAHMEEWGDQVNSTQGRQIKQMTWEYGLIRIKTDPEKTWTRHLAFNNRHGIFHEYFSTVDHIFASGDVHSRCTRVKVWKHENVFDSDHRLLTCSVSNVYRGANHAPSVSGERPF